MEGRQFHFMRDKFHFMCELDCSFSDQMTKFFRSFDEVDQLGVQVVAMASLADRNLRGKNTEI